MTTEAKSSPKWKWAAWLALKLYAGLCTLLVTAYVGLVLWGCFFPTPPAESSKMSVESLYAQYKEEEAPKRESCFCGLAQALATHTKDAPVPTADLFKYLGKPDFIAGTVETGTLVYICRYSGITNRYAMYSFIKNGRLTEIGFNEASANGLSRFQPYPR